jgi:glycogen debranching enzyme
MKTSRPEKHESDQLASQTSAVIPTKNNRKAVPFLPLVLFLIFIASILSGCKSTAFVPLHVENEQETVLSNETRLTPKDFLFGIHESHPLVQAVNKQADDILKSNRMTARVSIEENGKVIEKEFTFTTPSKIKEKDSHLDYAGKQWLWDSCFHAIILSEKEPEVAKKELRAVCSHQREDGFIPHMNYWSGDGQVPPGWAKEKGLHQFWSKPYCSDITQPPILALALEKVYNETKDEAYLREMLPKLARYYDYLHDKRDPERDKLISILHPWESGWDNSQRWDPVLGLPRNRGPVKRSDIDKKKIAVFISNVENHWDEAAIFAEGKFDVEPVDFNVLYCLNIKILSRLCSEIGDDNNARKFNRRADDTRKAIFYKMWDGDKYVDLFGKDDIKSSIKAASMFYPMMLDGEQHYEHLIENHLLNPDEFASPYGIPTTSGDDPTYAPDSYWRGNVWHNVNYFVVRGLKKVYREHEFPAAKEAMNYIMISSYITLYRGGSSEYFNPETGEGYGVKSFGWNGIVREMFSWYDSGFGGYSEALAAASDHPSLERLAGYMVSPSIFMGHLFGDNIENQIIHSYQTTRPFGG